MTTLFASPDIAALVAAFPPPLPTRNQPSLVRSHSGNGLLNSATVSDRFGTLLETEPNRIKKIDLLYRLGIEKVDWLLACYEGTSPIRWSGNGSSLIPLPAWEKVIEELVSQAQYDIVDLDVFAKNQDLERLSSADLEWLELSQSLHSIKCSVADASIYLSSNQHIETVTEQIRATTQEAGSEKINLSQLFSAVPYPVLRQLATKVISDDQLQCDEDDLVFVPSDYQIAQTQLLQAEREARIQRLVDQFACDDFVVVGQNSDVAGNGAAQKIIDRFTALNDQSQKPVIINIDSMARLVVQPELLNQTIQELKAEAARLISNDVEGTIEQLDEYAQSQLISTSSNAFLSGYLFKLHFYSNQVASALEEAISTKSRQQYEHFVTNFRRDVFGPLQLYLAGIKTVLDAKLKQSLDEYVTVYFKNEAIADFSKWTRSNVLQTKSKSMMRDMQKFEERANQAKSVDGLIVAVEKFAKKADIPSIPEDELEAIRRQILESKALKDMPKMSRGSDVLQNLTWILLSIAIENRAHNCIKPPSVNGDASVQAALSDRSGFPVRGLTLFMSPGKDTGRMIKQYTAVAPDDGEKSQKLAAWRDKLKAGSETKEDLNDMRTLAASVINHITINGSSSGDAAQDDVST